MAISDASAHTTLPVQDLDRAKAFYADVLGLEPFAEFPAGAMYEMPNGSRFTLFPTSGAPSGTHTQIGFRVEDVEAEVAEMQTRGAVFEEYDFPGFKTVNGVAAMGDIKSAFLKDSEGNLLGFVEMSDDIP